MPDRCRRKLRKLLTDMVADVEDREIACWRTQQHHDLISVSVESITDPNEIVIEMTGSDSDDDDMYAYTRLSIGDAIQLVAALRQAIGVKIIRDESNRRR